MRILLLFLLFQLLPLPYAHSQINVSPARQPAKQQQTLFSISAADHETSVELPAQFTIQATRARKKFVGKSRPGQPFDSILTQTDTLNVRAHVPGYYEVEEVMVVSCDTCASYRYVIRLDKEDPKTDSVFQNLTVDQAFRLDNVYFDQSSYVLRPASYPQLAKLVRTLLMTPKLVIEIAGHTDNVGDQRLNQALSENRAKIITNYLITNGVPEAQLRYAGYGSRKPVAPNDTEDNKRKNRRVEFVVLSL